MAMTSIARRRIVTAPRMGSATGVLLAGLLVTAASMPADEPNNTFFYAAIGVALSLAASLAVEMTGGLRALLRTDIIMLITLFALTFLEFLVPRRDIFGFAVSPDGAYAACIAVILGFAGIAIGRHIFAGSTAGAQKPAMDLPPNTMFWLLLLAFFFGYLHIFWAVNFDIPEAMRQMALPRFSQSWGRGRFGGWPELLVEVGALIYLVPPLTGIIFAQAQRYSILQKAVTAVLFLFTLYYGFAGGTRNVFGVYVITFAGAYLSMRPRITLKQIVLFAGPVMAVSVVAMYFMLEFRNVGLNDYSFSNAEFQGVFVDSNMVVIAQLTEVFPRTRNYLGFEIPYNALIRPIPRAIWPGKPEGLSIGMEEALGMEGLTLASTFVGEAYMAGGMATVVLAAVLFGAAAGKWNHMGRDISSNFNLILYVSGFFCAAIAMRSLLSSAPTVLPTLGLWVYGRFFLHRGRA